MSVYLCVCARMCVLMHVCACVIMHVYVCACVCACVCMFSHKVVVDCLEDL